MAAPVVNTIPVVVIFLGLLGNSASVTASKYKQASVILRDVTPGSFHAQIVPFYSPKAVATGNFSDTINSTGWSFLDISTDPLADDLSQAYTAGLLEGHLTRSRIAQHWNNTMKGYCVKPYNGYCQRLQTFLRNNTRWVSQQIQKFPNDTFWHQTSLMFAQVNGIIDGFSNKSDKPRFEIEDPMGLFLFMVDGDTEDLEMALKKPNLRKVTGSGSCSGLIKVTSDFSDIMVAQDTWSTYQSMLRIIKKYNFSFHITADQKSSLVPATTVSFSGYPGSVVSGDDFYTTDAGLVTLETTNGNMNKKLLDKITPYSVFENFRSMIANRLANSGKTWVSIFSRYNSGTYNNQWMITDMKLFQKGHKNLSSGLLYVAEQIPGKIASGDLTDILQKQTYWPSFNIPYFHDIYKESGYPKMAEQYGDWFTHEDSPRAKIFKRDHVKVKDLTSMTTLMRYNDYKNDPISKCKCTPPYSAENAISARSDLNPANGTYPFGALGHRSHGGTDMKLTSFNLMKKIQFLAISGPTYDTQPPFQWSKSDFKDLPHEGHPDIYKFPPVLHDWQSP